METFDAVKNRFSLRKYKPDPIPEAVLQTILEAARLAPSWANAQATRYVLVTDPEIKAKLSETLSPKNPSTRAVATAPVVIALCYVKGESGYYNGQPTTILEGQWGVFDAGLAAANLSLAAVAEGLGTVHVGALNIDKAAEILGVPGNVQLLELIPLGYPNQSFNSPKRKDPGELFFHNQYGKSR